MEVKGLPFFFLETHLNDDFKLIEAEFGLRGFAIVVKLFQKIYGERGYYCEWTNDVELLFSNNVNEGRSFVSEIVRASVKRGLFDKDLYERYGVLTSSGIQTQYLKAVSRRTQINVINEYLLVKVNQIPKNVNIISKSVDNFGENADISGQRREENNREENNREENNREEERRKSSAAAAVFATYEKYIGLVTPSVIEGIEFYISKGMEPELIIRIIEYACEQGKRSWQYIDRAVLGNLKDDILTLDAYKRNQADRAERQKVDGKKTKSSKFNNYDDDNAGDYAELEAQILDMMLEDD